ncbi:MAG: hypothetical protein EOO39_00540 [Cytophagaceae bacterium]|nr:MAG: hypothetical protein EOO39_00540 [Cytophagaceae bacterium]
MSKNDPNPKDQISSNEESKLSPLTGLYADVSQRLILESNLGYTIFTTNLQRWVTSWNRGAQAMLGYDKA